MNVYGKLKLFSLKINNYDDQRFKSLPLGMAKLFQINFDTIKKRVTLFSFQKQNPEIFEHFTQINLKGIEVW